MSNVAFAETTSLRKFKEGLEDVNDDDRPGRLRTSTTYENIKAVRKMILNNRRIIIRGLTDDVGISFGSCQAIFVDVLGMKRTAVKIVPRLVYFEQKQRRSEYVDDVQRRSGVAQIDHKW